MTIVASFPATRHHNRSFCSLVNNGPLVFFFYPRFLKTKFIPNDVSKLRFIAKKSRFCVFFYHQYVCRAIKISQSIGIKQCG